MDRPAKGKSFRAASAQPVQLTHLAKHLATVVPTTEPSADAGVRRVLSEFVVLLARGEVVEIEGLGRFWGKLTPSVEGEERLRILFDGAIPDVPAPADNPFLAKQPFKLAREMLQAIDERRTYHPVWQRLDTKQSWRDRAEQVAAFLRPGDVVADIGCGEMPLEKVLPEGCRYLPFDVVKRDDRTTIIDLNSDEPLPAFTADVICCLGLIEYLFEPRKALAALSTRGPRMIVTYNATDAEGAKGKQRPVGWVANLTVSELERMFDEIGLRVTEKTTTPNERQFIYVLERAT